MNNALIGGLYKLFVEADGDRCLFQLYGRNSIRFTIEIVYGWYIKVLRFYMDRHHIMKPTKACITRGGSKVCLMTFSSSDLTADNVH